MKWNGWIRIRYEDEILIQIFLKSGILFASDVQARWVSVEYWMRDWFRARWLSHIGWRCVIGIIGEMAGFGGYG